jgi:5-methylcytosine-specific restriction endonuclease McrA
MRAGKKTIAHKKACRDYKERFYLRHGYYFCENCNRSDKAYSVHHIYRASRWSFHKEFHNALNMMLLCYKCHDKFDNGNEMTAEFQQLQQERGLYKLFGRE